jgi:hypothetical protein
MLIPDLRYAIRSLSRARGFALAVIVTLALGIGANTAIFSVVRGVLLKPLPHRDGELLVYLRHSMDGPGGENLTFSVPEVRDLRSGAPSFAGLAQYSSFSMIYQSDQAAERIGVGLVTGNYFDVMGLSPILGRLTRQSDDGPGVPPVVVLAHQYWMKRFGGDSGIVSGGASGGSSTGTSFAIIGISTRKMISSTSSTSIIGVTLMSRVEVPDIPMTQRYASGRASDIAQRSRLVTACVGGSRRVSH